MYALVLTRGDWMDPSVSDEAWLSISEFLTARELGQVGRCSSDLRVISLDPWVWKLLFYRVWLRSDPRSHLGRVPRPKGADAIGWKIRVFSEEWRRWNEARIIGMRQVGDKVQWQLKYPLLSQFLTKKKLFKVL